MSPSGSNVAFPPIIMNLYKGGSVVHSFSVEIVLVYFCHKQRIMIRSQLVIWRIVTFHIEWYYNSK